MRHLSDAAASFGQVVLACQQPSHRRFASRGAWALKIQVEVVLTERDELVNRVGANFNPPVPVSNVVSNPRVGLRCGRFLHRDAPKAANALAKLAPSGSANAASRNSFTLCAGLPRFAQACRLAMIWSKLPRPRAWVSP